MKQRTSPPVDPPVISPVHGAWYHVNEVSRSVSSGAADFPRVGSPTGNPVELFQSAQG